MIDADLMGEVLTGEFSPVEPTEEQSQFYLENFGWANIIVDRLCPDLHPDALVYEITMIPEEPNAIFKAARFTGPIVCGEMIGDPVVKIIAKEALIDLIDNVFSLEAAA